MNVPKPEVFDRYKFNPYQLSPPEAVMLDFHGRHVEHFVGCSNVVDLGAGPGFFLRELKRRGINGLEVENYGESIAAGEKHGVQYIKTDIFDFLRALAGA